MNKIGERVYERRRELGLSQSLLCYQGGFSPTHLVLLEKHGLVPRNRKTREKIAHALGMTHDELFQEGDLFMP